MPDTPRSAAYIMTHRHTPSDKTTRRGDQEELLPTYPGVVPSAAHAEQIWTPLMAYPAHAAVRIQGAIGDLEVWSINLRFGVEDDFNIPYETLYTWASGIAAAEEGNVVTTGLRTLLSSLVTIETIRTEYILPGGVLDSAAEYSLPAPVSGIGGGSRPPQTAVVASLLSGRPGRTRRGRIYWPALGGTSSGLRVASTTVADVAHGTVTLLAAIVAACPVAVTPAIVSAVAGTVTPITQVQVGNVWDTQRRRRDAIGEVYTTEIYPLVDDTP